MRKKLLTGATGIVLAIVLAAGPAAARDCFIASRSDNGNLKAGTHSAVWTIVTVHDFLVEELGFTEICANGAVAAIGAAGMPTQFTTRSNKTIGENSSNPNLANGKGLDHLEESPISGAVVDAAFAYRAVHC